MVSAKNVTFTVYPLKWFYLGSQVLEHNFDVECIVRCVYPLFFVHVVPRWEYSLM